MPRTLPGTLALAVLCLMQALACAQGRRAAATHSQPPAAQAAPRIPAAATASTDTLAGWLRAAYPEPEARLKATYAWIVANLRYDHASAFDFAQPEVDESARADSALAARQDVCAGIAAVFKTLCRKSGLAAYSIAGYARRQGYVGHAWVAVRSQEGFFLYDPTWDINQREQPRTAGLPWAWFRKAPADFIRTHMPFDPLWQLSAAPVSYQDFEAGRFKAAAPAATPFAFADSIAAYGRQPDLERKQAIYRRMRPYQAGGGNAVALYRQALRNGMVVAGHRRFNAVADSGVARLNAFVAGYNAYINHFNRRFEDVPDDAYLPALLARLHQDLDASDAYLAQAEAMTDEPAQRQNLAEHRAAVAENAERLRQHEAFVASYLSKDKLGRAFIWGSADVPR